MDKPDYKKIRLFEILDRIGIVNYKLNLLETIRINLVFYVLLLELVLPNARTFAPELDEVVNETVEYKVEKILERTEWVNGKLRYRVRWKGYSE